ncbi:MAG: alkyl hydroperoxide reductase [Saprospiraceae bacterium]|nr:alkyl hydroperoxide reductase [Saprospiraceae bacterium]
MKLDLEVLEVVFTNKGNDLRTIAEQKNVMLIFLRHFGCAFCREALADFALIKNDLDIRKVKLVFIHMADEQTADEYLDAFGLKGEEHISDPDMSLYEYFGLQKGGFRELYGLKVWMRLVRQKNGSLIQASLGNVKQMPGIFMLHKGEIVNSFIHKSAADKPDYLDIADC